MLKYWPVFLSAITISASISMSYAQPVALTFAVIKCDRASGTKDNHLPPLDGLSRYKTDGNTRTFERVPRNPDKAGEKKTVLKRRFTNTSGPSGYQDCTIRMTAPRR
jgi:hypothetical protein